MALQLPRLLTPGQQKKDARAQSDAWYRAAVGTLPTDQSVADRGAAAETYTQQLAQGLAKRLRESQTALATAGGAAPGVILAQSQQAAQPANAAAIAAGGHAAAPPTGAANFAALVGANSANALAGLEPAAVAMGNRDAGLVRRQTSDQLQELGRTRSGLRADAQDKFVEALRYAAEQDFQRRTASDQSQLTWASYDADIAAQLADQALKAAGLQQDQSQFDASQAAKAGAQADLNAYRAAQLDLARQRIDASLAGKAGDPAKRIETITREANRYAQSLRSQTQTAPDATTTTGMKHQVIVRWVESESKPNPANPLNDPALAQQYPPIVTEKPVEKTISLTGKNWADVEAQVRAAYGSKSGFSYAPLGQPEPVTSTTPGGSKRSVSDDNVRGQVFQLLRSYNIPVAQAKRIALRIVPQKPKARTGGAPTQADAGDR